MNFFYELISVCSNSVNLFCNLSSWYHWNREFLLSTALLEPPYEGCSWCSKGACIPSQSRIKSDISWFQILQYLDWFCTCNSLIVKFDVFQECSTKVVWLSYKLSVIDLQKYNAKLSDFGLAKDGPVDGKSHVSTRIMGTYGYAAPEYMVTGKELLYSYMFVQFLAEDITPSFDFLVP